MKIITRSLFCLLGKCESCGSPDDKHSCVYTCLISGEGKGKILCVMCLSQYDTSNMNCNYFGVLVNPQQIRERDIFRMKDIPTLVNDLYANNWEKVVGLKIVVQIIGQWYWIAGTDPNYWMNEQ